MSDLKQRVEKAINDIIIEDGELTQYERENVVSDILAIFAATLKSLGIEGEG